VVCLAWGNKGLPLYEVYSYLSGKVVYGMLSAYPIGATKKVANTNHLYMFSSCTNTMWCGGGFSLCTYTWITSTSFPQVGQIYISVTPPSSLSSEPNHFNSSWHSLHSITPTPSNVYKLYSDALQEFLKLESV
jgi:hypothetical protein